MYEFLIKATTLITNSSKYLIIIKYGPAKFQILCINQNENILSWYQDVLKSKIKAF